MALSKILYREKIMDTFNINCFTFQALIKFRNGFCNLFCRKGGPETISMTTQLKRNPREGSL